MEKSRMEFLSEIQQTLSELKERISEIESRLAEFEELAEEEVEPVDTPVDEDLPAPEEDLSPIDISIDVEDFDSGVTEPAPAAPETAPAPKADGLLMDEEPAAPKASINDRQERHVKKAVMDVMNQKPAWKTAIPGTPVKNVISAISLNDRVLFINTLFKEDPMAFQDAIAAFNGMSSFEEAEEYVKSNHPEWNLNSDLVFRLMMAVRRKLR